MHAALESTVQRNDVTSAPSDRGALFFRPRRSIGPGTRLACRSCALESIVRAEHGHVCSEERNVRGGQRNPGLWDVASHRVASRRANKSEKPREALERRAAPGRLPNCTGLCAASRALCSGMAALLSPRPSRFFRLPRGRRVPSRLQVATPMRCERAANKERAPRALVETRMTRCTARLGIRSRPTRRDGAACQFAG